MASTAIHSNTTAQSARLGGAFPYSAAWYTSLVGCQDQALADLLHADPDATAQLKRHLAILDRSIRFLKSYLDAATVGPQVEDFCQACIELGDKNNVVAFSQCPAYEAELWACWFADNQAGHLRRRGTIQRRPDSELA